MRRRRAAFTTIELMVVTVIFAIVVAALYRFLSAGTRQVSVGSEEVEGIRQANVAMERIQRDLRAISDVVDVNDKAPELTDAGMTFMRFSPETDDPVPHAFKVVYKTTKEQVKRSGQLVDAVRLQIFYANAKLPVYDENCFSDVRFRKYRLNGLPFYQVRLDVADPTGKSKATHYLQTSVGSRFYQTLFGEIDWVQVPQGVPTIEGPRRER